MALFLVRLPAEPLAFLRLLWLFRWRRFGSSCLLLGCRYLFFFLRRWACHFFLRRDCSLIRFRWFFFALLLRLLLLGNWGSVYPFDERDPRRIALTRTEL